MHKRAGFSDFFHAADAASSVRVSRTDGALRTVGQDVFLKHPHVVLAQKGGCFETLPCDRYLRDQTNKIRAESIEEEVLA